MANNCTNWLTFSGAKRSINKAVKEIKADEEFQDLYVDNTNDETSLLYTTRWAPNVETLQEICKKHSINVLVFYEELGSDAYGKTYINGEDGSIVDVCLPEHRFPKYIKSKGYYKVKQYILVDEQYAEYLEQALEQEDVLQKFPEFKVYAKNANYYSKKLVDWSETFTEAHNEEEEDEEENSKCYDNLIACATKLYIGTCTLEDFKFIQFHLYQQKGLTIEQ